MIFQNHPGHLMDEIILFFLFQDFLQYIQFSISLALLH